MVSGLSGGKGDPSERDDVYNGVEVLGLLHVMDSDIFGMQKISDPTRVVVSFSLDLQCGHFDACEYERSMKYHFNLRNFCFSL